MDLNQLLNHPALWVWVRRVLLVLLGANLPQLAMDAATIWQPGV